MAAWVAGRRARAVRRRVALVEFPETSAEVEWPASATGRPSLDGHLIDKRCVLRYQDVAACGSSNANVASL